MCGSQQRSRTLNTNRDLIYIGGKWQKAKSDRFANIVNPSDETSLGQVVLGSQDDVDDAVRSAHEAFVFYSETTKEFRLDLMSAIIRQIKSRSDELADAVSNEMGSPVWLSKGAHVPLLVGHFESTQSALRELDLEQRNGSTMVVLEPVGVCGLITPWNWPLNQIGAKVAPAIAAGCTMLLKPSENASLSAHIFAEIIDEAGVPAGVFNLVHGDGLTGAAISSHPLIDMVSFTGSTRAGIEVARNAAPTVKRVAQELGGKSANIVLDDADFSDVISRDVKGLFVNSGQSCNALSRLLVPESRKEEVVEIARAAAQEIVVGDPLAERTFIGPVSSKRQFDKIQDLIASAIADGARVVSGGIGRPNGLPQGYYVQPTVLADVTPDMKIAREEIFGPVVTIMTYKTEEEAIAIANNSEYGLAGAVSSSDLARARQVARKIRTGMVHINGASLETESPFGGYKQSGNGREFGHHGLKEFFEVKSIYGDIPS